MILKIDFLLLLNQLKEWVKPQYCLKYDFEDDIHIHAFPFLVHLTVKNVGRGSGATNSNL